MSTVEPIIINEHQPLVQDDHDWDSVFHVEWETDANFFTGLELRPRTPLCKATADHQVTLARAAALIIRASLNNIPLDDPDFDPSKLLGYRKQLYRWMQSYNSSEASKLVLGPVSMTVTIEILSSLMHMGVEGELLAKLGPNLGGILNGSIDPMPLLLQGNRTNRMQDGMELVQKTRSHLRAYLSSYATKKPVLNILEVGATTSNTTETVISALTGQDNMTFTMTDKSLSVLEQVTSNIDKGDFIKVKKLDVNQDPLGQGYSSALYDVVVVNNLLHASNSIEETVANLRQLLVPGGVLALIGLSDVSPAYSLILGMNECMWSDERCEQLPYPTSGEWTELLRDNGFSGLEPATRTFDHIGQSGYCVISTAVASTQNPMVNIISGNLSGFAEQLAPLLAHNGTASTITHTLPDDISPRCVYVILDDETHSLAQYQSLSGAKNVLWVSMKAEGPDAVSQRDMSVVTRFARGARKENDTLKLVKLDVKQDYPEYSKVLKVVTRIIRVSFQEDRGTRTELEYVYRNNRVLVPRIKGSSVTNKVG
ncbi:hypothetical protein F66182_5416 [Fusarium sp. NRRL 66182]|nr:hypothetical protein F66182_5416 [Fusarium sp. NRRL 66182]